MSEKLDNPEDLSYNRFLASAKWYQKLNIGALVLTPLWLLVNGMWLTLLVHTVVAILYLPFTLLFSILFFLNGTTWSWRNGARWGCDSESFLEVQFGVTLLAVVATSALLIISLLNLADNWF